MKTESRKAYKGLLTRLRSMIKVYRDLLALVRKEREILISAKLDDLSENNKSKEAMLLKVREMENERIQLARDLAISEQLSEGTTLLEFARHFDGDIGEELRHVHSVLELLLKRVHELNQQNESLVQSALTTVTGAMDSIRDHVQERVTYEKKGSIDPGRGGSGRLVSREA
jgi:hypothetical protein